MMTLLGYFAGESAEVRNKLLSYLARVMPSSAIDLVHTTLNEITQARSGSKLSLGLLAALWAARSEEHTSELQSQSNLVCRLLLEKKKKKKKKKKHKKKKKKKKHK